MEFQEIITIINSAGVIGVLALALVAERKRANDAWKLISDDWERQRQRETEDTE